WALGLVVFCFSHVAMFFLLPESINPVGGAAGWVLFLVLLTESHDIAQALWGRRFGKHKLIPHISPGKTWEGLILGTLTTLTLAVLLAPVLTPLSASGRFARPLLGGLLIAVGGLFGDLTMSAVKRDVGVKDSGTLIPGQGGLLDRIDSLTFTAPMFFYFVYFLYA
ncbi:MAG: CDP-archaeol synthase, partial [Planctomycetota bacterium]|nr:CDP-archaeol synthase [Planctomycetota bacterium]